MRVWLQGRGEKKHRNGLGGLEPRLLSSSWPIVTFRLIDLLCALDHPEKSLLARQSLDTRLGFFFQPQSYADLKIRSYANLPASKVTMMAQDGVSRIINISIQ